MRNRTFPSFLFPTVLLQTLLLPTVLFPTGLSRRLFLKTLLFIVPLLPSSWGQAAQLRGVDPTLSHIRLLDGADQLVATANPTPDTPKSLAYVGDALQLAFDFQDSDCAYAPSSEDYDSCVLAEQPDLRQVYWFGGQQSESGLHRLTAQDQTSGDRSITIVAQGLNQQGRPETAYQQADFAQLMILDNFQDDNAHADETQLNSIWVMAAGDAPTLKFLRPVLEDDMGALPAHPVTQSLDWVDAAGVRQANYQSHHWLLASYQEATHYCQSIGAQVPTLAQMHRLTQAGAPDALNQQSDLFAHFALYRHAWPKDSDIRYWTRKQVPHSELRIAAAIATHIEQVHNGDLLIENYRSPDQLAALICVQPSDQVPSAEWQTDLPASIMLSETRPVTFTLHNKGPLPLQQIAVTFSLPQDLTLQIQQNDCQQSSLAAGQSCHIQGQLSANFAGQYRLQASASAQGMAAEAVITHEIRITSSQAPTTVKCPNVPAGNLFEIGQAVPYRVMQDGEDARAGVRNGALRDKLEQGEERWCVSQVTDMNRVFKAAPHFNQPIGDWDVGQVTTMYEMFHSATNFNQPIGDWDVGQVTDMVAVFYQASKFNQPIGNWNVSKVTAVSHMFKHAISFNQPIGDWDVSQVTSMYQMFEAASSFNQPLTGWNRKTGQVTSMGGMFAYASQFNQDLTGWDVHQVTDHKYFNYSSGLPDAKCPKFNDGRHQ